MNTGIDELLAQLAGLGIGVVYKGDDQLALTGNTSAATPEILQQLRDFKAILLERHLPKPERCRKCSATVCRPDMVSVTCEKGNLCPYYKKVKNAP